MENSIIVVFNCTVEIILTAPCNNFIYCLMQFLNIHESILQTQLTHIVMIFFERIRTIKIVLLETSEKSFTYGPAEGASVMNGVWCT